MLALLFAPRGRISAARLAAQARKRRLAQAHRTVIRLPEAPGARASDSTAAERNDADPTK